MLDRKFNLGLSEEQENAPSEGHKRIEEIEKGGYQKVSGLCRESSLMSPTEYAENVPAERL